MKYAVFDTELQVWIGNSDGVATFHDFHCAEIAAQLCDARMKCFKRFEVREFEHAGRYAGEVTPPLSMRQAIDALCV